MNPIQYHLVIMLCFLTFTTGLAASEPREAQKPIALLLQEAYDFGMVVEGNPVSYDFTLKNIGTVSLKILRLESG